jgi:hypothetical protein
MTIDEFRALKTGDRIRNAMSESSGVIADVANHRGRVSVHVQWDGNDMTFGPFGEYSTAWMHWTLEGEA